MPGELGHAVDERAHLVAELPPHLRDRGAGVLHGVVQQRGAQRGGVQPHAGADLRDADGMHDEVLARGPALVGVALAGEHERLLHQLAVDRVARLAGVLLHDGEQVARAGRAGRRSGGSAGRRARGRWSPRPPAGARSAARPPPAPPFAAPRRGLGLRPFCFVARLGFFSARARLVRGTFGMAKSVDPGWRGESAIPRRARAGSATRLPRPGQVGLAPRAGGRRRRGARPTARGRCARPPAARHVRAGAVVGGQPQLAQHAQQAPAQRAAARIGAAAPQRRGERLALQRPPSAAARARHSSAIEGRRSSCARQWARANSHSAAPHARCTKPGAGRRGQQVDAVLAPAAGRAPRGA